jgi:hypothetical protein
VSPERDRLRFIGNNGADIEVELLYVETLTLSAIILDTTKMNRLCVCVAQEIRSRSCPVRL